MSTRINSRTKAGASGNLSRRTQSSISRDPGGPTRVATTIAFTSPATITDSGNGLAVFRVGTSITIRGSALNSRRVTVATSAAGTLTVTPAMIQTASAGPLVTLSSDD